MTPRVGIGVRPAYREIELYAPARDYCATDLSDNTNLWGPPPAAARALADSPNARITRYPATYSSGLKSALAAYLGVSAETVVTGCGSDDVLDSAIRAFTEPGQLLALPDPSFAMVPVFARMNGLEVLRVPLTSSLDADWDALAASGAAIVYLCSPNNPTGDVLNGNSLRAFLERFAGITILDQAYSEFSGGSNVHLLGEFERLIIVGTMSKAFGLAGLRIGYAVASPAAALEIEKSRGPYKVSGPAETAALAALTTDLQWVRERVQEVQRGREELVTALAERGVTCLPSRSNFVLVPLAGATELSRAMRAMGVAVRAFENLPRIGDSIRVTIGPSEMMERFLEVFDQARKSAGEAVA